ncbi:MAG: T9SS type A sorting domain-containing protein [Bacteroidales bacterium]|jgi:hypothetical protein|nr:T9SS type A sorting domain-containing protein [Bacteroidales bacterium]
MKTKFVLSLIIALAFGSGNLYAQHLFSVSYNELSRENVNLIHTQVARSNASIMPTMKNTKGEYAMFLSSVQNTKIILLNEETGANVVITPTKEAPAEFVLPLFFIEELRQSALGNADRYLIIKAGTDFSVRNTASLSAQTGEVFIPRYFYGPKENVKEALPQDRQIAHIFKQKPRLIPAFPDDPEHLLQTAQLEEEMSYYVYMYQLPDGTLIIYDEHFNPSTKKNGVNTSVSANTKIASPCCKNLQFNLSGNLAGQAYTSTLYALNIWSAELIGNVPVDISVTQTVLSNPNALGASYATPDWFHPATETWYPASLANQIAGYNVAPGLLDIYLEMSSTANWYYPETGNPPGNQVDWITVMLHEITHGLGFAPGINRDGRYLYGIWRETGYGWATFTDHPNIFARQLYEGLSGPNLTDLNQSERAALIVSGNLYAGRPGSHLLAANGGTRVKMYAPAIYSSGSSVSHWDNSVTFPTFMKYSYQGKLHTINEREIAIMQDIGWECPPIVTPVFPHVQTLYCSGSNIPPLPTTSENGITGTWSPVINNTVTTTYTFTPTLGCADTVTLTITITNGFTATFASEPPIDINYCKGSIIPALPTTSNEGATGSWSPEINNTVTTTYTFTSTAGSCISAQPVTIPVFSNLHASTFSVPTTTYCSGASIPPLPTTSNEGTIGIWSPEINNTVTTLYTFTPTVGCGRVATLTINISNNVTPTFAPIGTDYCSGSNIPPLPTKSENGITGTWSPAINNTATTTYTFTPMEGECAKVVTLTINIINPLDPEKISTYRTIKDMNTSIMLGLFLDAVTYDGEPLTPKYVASNGIDGIFWQAADPQISVQNWKWPHYCRVTSCYCESLDWLPSWDCSVPGACVEISTINRYEFIYVEVALSSMCGKTDWVKIKYSSKKDPISFSIIHSPNPVNHELTIDFIELPTPKDATETYSVKLLDHLGNPRQQTQFRHSHRDGKANPVKFNTSFLPPGTYYLHVEGAGELVREPIIVTR